MKKALRLVIRRVRVQQGLTGLCWGLLAALALGGSVMFASFLLPMARRSVFLLLCSAALPLGGLIGLLWPVSTAQAARIADGCGLRERTQTALALIDRQDEMARLQRADALKALESLDLRAALPLRMPIRPLLIAAGCAAVTLTLFLIPNPQDAVLRRQAQFAQKMEKPAQAIEKAADQLNEAQLGEKTAQELRRLMGDLARQVREAREPREALSALSQGQQRLERQLADSRKAASEALGQAGMDSLAQAVESADAQTMEQAMEAESGDAAELADQLDTAAQSTANAAASAALQAAAAALRSGSAAKAAQALGQLSAASLGQGQLAAALQSAKALAGGSGQGQGQGSGESKGNGDGNGNGGGNGSGQGKGSGGAGQGSTNQDMSGRGGASSGSGGSRPAGYKLGQYEAIYDPTRLGDGGEITQSTGKVDENAQVSELTLTPGLGDASGFVPYDQVVGDYQSAAVQRAQEAALPGYAQQWVADYFTALTE